MKLLTAKNLGIYTWEDFLDIYYPGMEVRSAHMFEMMGLDKDNPDDKTIFTETLVKCGLYKPGVTRSFTFDTIEKLLLWEYLIGNTGYRFKRGMKLLCPVKKKELPMMDRPDKKKALKWDDYNLDHSDIESRLKRICPGMFTPDNSWMTTIVVKNCLIDPESADSRDMFLSNVIFYGSNSIIREDNIEFLNSVKVDLRVIKDDSNKACIKYRNQFLNRYLDKIRWCLKYVLKIPSESVKEVLTSETDAHKEMNLRLKEGKYCCLPEIQEPYVDHVIKYLNL